MLNKVKSRKAGRKIISFMHISLDGFVAGLSRYLPAGRLSGGEMNRIKVDEEFFDHVCKRINPGDIMHYKNSIV
jgi:hypothetical protein